MARSHDFSVQNLVRPWISEDIRSITPVGGGSINNSYKVGIGNAFYFVKVNTSVPADFFEKEALGLELLGSNSKVKTPEILFKDSNILILEYLERGRQSPNFWTSLGRQLAELHKISSDRYGLEYDNYIGSLPQVNGWKESWPEFFVEKRLLPLAKQAVEAGKLDSKSMVLFERLFSKIGELIYSEKPSLLHGDLWSGNIMADSTECPVLIDPAVYYGHREIEIAFTYLFGGFDALFYKSYCEAFPMEKDFEDRIDLYNLYPLLVHVNLFGGSYANSVMSTLRRFV